MSGEFKAAIFDLDGTLLYTLEDLADSLNLTLKEEGLPTHDLEAYRFMVGNGLEQLVVRALPAGMRIPAHVRPIFGKFIERYRANLWVKTRPYEGIPEALEELRGLGLRLAVLSNKNHPNTVLIVEHFFPGLFEMVLGLRPEVPAKPHPAGAEEILTAFGLGPHEVIYLGDSDVDMETAVAARLFPVGAGWGYRPREELAAAGALAIVETPAQFPAYIRAVHEAVEEDKRREEEALCGLPPKGLLSQLDLGRQVTPPPAWAAARPDIAEKMISRPGSVRLALTGGVASGKSIVAEMLVEKGAGHIDFDLLARRAVEPGTPGFEAVTELFGPEVVRADGQLDRGEIGRRVFSSPELKKALEDIIHPTAWVLAAGELEAMSDKTVVVLSVPLLFEAGLETYFKPILMVFTCPETQIRRLMTRNPELGQEGAVNIITSQWPAPPKVMGSTFIINNNGSLEETAAQIQAIWPEITG